jgi:hypothetical protein
MLKPLFIVIAIAVVMQNGCSDRESARETLDRWGYEDAVVGGYSFLGCSRPTYYKTEFTLTRNGYTQRGAVCAERGKRPFVELRG